MTTQFELRRQSDDLVYSFVKRDRPDGLLGFQRADRDLWIIFRDRLGWVAWNEESQTVMGRPWDLLPEDQPTDCPPEGDWVSKKGAKSYVYDLVHTNRASHNVSYPIQKIQTDAISNTVIYLVGAAGVGKMTIGKHLADTLNAPLIHNHLWLNPIFGVIEQDGVTPLPAEVWPLTAQVRRAVFQAASSLTPPSWNLVFTHAAVGQGEADEAIADEIIAVARARKARLAVVQLTCSAIVLAERVATPSRKDFMKETDTAAALINASLPSFTPKAGTIFKLETTGLSAENSAQEVIRRIETAPEIAVP